MHFTIKHTQKKNVQYIYFAQLRHYKDNTDSIETVYCLYSPDDALVSLSLREEKRKVLSLIIVAYRPSLLTPPLILFIFPELSISINFRVSNYFFS